MKLSIETKFNIGDTVYIAERFEDWFAYKKPYIIFDISISANSQIVRILYEVQQDRFTDSVPEDLVFSTYEECVKWCDECKSITPTYD